MQRISISGPSITQLEIDYVTDAVTHGWYERANEYQDRFERAASDYLGVRFAVALPSCTAAIHLALAAAGVQTGDEVIVPEITWIASSAPVHYLGARPVFADIDRRSWCVDAESIRARRTARTKAVIAVDLYGQVPDMAAIRQWAADERLVLIEDAAQAFGSEWRGQKAGSLGDIGVFSFHGSKTATTGEGGMLVTDSQEIFDRVRFLRDHGRVPGDNRFLHEEIAYKYRMSSMQAALGLAQVERAEELVERKRQIFQWYRERLESVPGIRLNPESADVRSTYWMVTVLTDPALGLNKHELARKLDECSIDTRPFFYPLSALPAYANTEEGRRGRRENPVAYELSPFGINLPSGMNMTRDKVAYVADAVQRIVGRAGVRAD